jgi:hypothetical protein
LTQGVYSGLTYGTEATTPSGENTLAVLVASATGKTIKPLRIGWTVTGDELPGTTLYVALRRTSDGAITPLAEAMDFADINSNGELSNLLDFGRIGTDYHAWIDGVLEADLVAYYTGTPPTGGEITFWAQAWLAN